MVRNVEKEININPYLDKEKEIKLLCQAIEKGDWNDPIFKDLENFPYYALAIIKVWKNCVFQLSLFEISLFIISNPLNLRWVSYLARYLAKNSLSVSS